MFFGALPPSAVEPHAGRYYRFAERAGGEQTTIAVENAFPPDKADIDRDDAWRRRLELWEDVSGLLQHEPDRGEILDVLTKSYLEAFDPGATEDDLLRTFTTNTQACFDERVQAYLTGARTYDVAQYERGGVCHSGYSHIAHLGWVYAKQIELLERLLERERPLTVVDVGTGAGHFVLTVRNHLAGAGRLGEVRLIGIDRSKRDMRFGAELAAEVELEVDDLTDPAFADRLRRRRPDVIVANHVLEHVEGEIKNRYLHDWLLAARVALTVSVPLGNGRGSSICGHVQRFTAADVTSLASQMAHRVAGAVEPQRVEATGHGGLCSWVRIGGCGLSGRFLRLQPQDPEMTPDPDPILQDFGTPFDPAAFSTARRAPTIGEVHDRATFEQQGGDPGQVRQLLIKMPGSDVVLPEEFGQFREAVQIIVDHNRAANPDYDASYGYLNVFRGVTDFSSYRGLSLNRHGDQLQGLRLEYAYKPDWSYIVSNTLPTIMYDQGFDMSAAVERFNAGGEVNLYDYMNAQAKAALSYRSHDFGIHLLSPYVVHAASAAEQGLWRVFLKVAFSTKRFFDNRELRRNPAFDIEAWYQADTVGRVGGWLSHGHWNERFLKEDVCPGWRGERAEHA